MISHCWISPAAQEDRVHSEISGDPACANVYLWHPEGPPRPPGEGAPTQDHLPEHRRDRAGDAGVGLGAHIPEHADPSAVRLLRPQLSLLGPRPQQLLWRWVQLTLGSCRDHTVVSFLWVPGNVFTFVFRRNSDSLHYIFIIAKNNKLWLSGQSYSWATPSYSSFIFDNESWEKIDLFKRL